MSACGDVFNKAELGSGVRVLEPIPVRYSNPKPLHSHPRDRHSSHALACRRIVSMPILGRLKVRRHLLMRQIAVANGEAPGKVDTGREWGNYVAGERQSPPLTATPRAPIGT